MLELSPDSRALTGEGGKCAFSIGAKTALQTRLRTASGLLEKIMPNNQIAFFATARDVVPVLSELEAATPLQYTKMGLFRTDAPETCSSCFQIPEFGRAKHASAVGNPYYLVTRRHTPIEVRSVPQKNGDVLFAIDQLKNPDSIGIRPGGIYDQTVILSGMLRTASSSAHSKALYKTAKKLFRAHFWRQDEYLIGSMALSLWRSGVRLTDCASSSEEFDIKRTD